MFGTGLEIRDYESLRDRLVYLAWRRYHIRSEDAEDLVQIALTTWLEVRDRYADREIHPTAILTGIFHNKCREHLHRIVRDQAALTRLRRQNSEPPSTPSALNEVLHREKGARILEAIGRLRPEAREAFQLLVDEDLGRQGLIDRLKVNKNTLDSRLHVYRRELRKLLRRLGILP